MSLFGNGGQDPFDDMVREFFGGDSPQGIQKAGRRNQFIQGEEEDRTIDFIESEDNVYIVFELPGFSKEDVQIVVSGKELEIVASKKTPDNIQPYLVKRLNQGIQIKKNLPGIAKPKNFEHSFKNGILEVIFKRK